MKKSVKTSSAKAAKPAKDNAHRPFSEMSKGSLIPILGGKAALTFGATALDGRTNCWICKTDGTRVERVLANDIAEAEVRAQQLLDKGALA